MESAMPNDIFVSYAREDNASPPDAPDLKGFVDFLLEQLRYEFQQLGQPRPTIFRDTRRIDAADSFEPALVEGLQQSSLLLVVLSSNWMGRPWCQRELETFVAGRRRQGETDDDIRSRIVVAHKQYLKPDSWPTWLQGKEGVSFFHRDEDDHTQPETPFFSRGKADPRYVPAIQRLAQALRRRITDEPSAPGKPVAPQRPRNGRIVYLAKAAADLFNAYQRIWDELDGRGFTVVPDRAAEIPKEAGAKEWIDAALADTEVSIHLLGEKKGYAPEELDPIVQLQLQRAGVVIDQSTAGGEAARFRRLIWAPALLPEADRGAEAQLPRDPLQVLQSLDQQRTGDKIDGSNLSEFVEFLLQHLARMETAPQRQNGAGGDLRVYVNHRLEDTEYAVNLASALQQLQIEPVFPALDGDPREVEELHKQNLKECDAVVLCYASASEVWVRANAAVLADWNTLGRSQQFRCRAVVTGPPENIRKSALQKIKPREIDVVLNLTDKALLSPTDLAPLLVAS
ncbi:MAG: TIR domain-containing protein [Methylococcaceae bacterium]|nr:TIR domain-containing protein [Methylococcaceae bacterium]